VLSEPSTSRKRNRPANRSIGGHEFFCTLHL
jgi:hypothetical protein